MTNVRMRPRLIIPLLIQVIYQSILIFVSPTPSTAPAPGVLTQAHTTVPAAGGHEARAGRSEDDEHVLSTH
jgi:hypothetical protein